MNMDEILNPPVSSLQKIYLDIHNGDANAANLALQNDLKTKKPMSSLIGKKPIKRVDKNAMRLAVKNAELELQKSGLHAVANPALLRFKREHGV
jgi:hypothetical protein